MAQPTEKTIDELTDEMLAAQRNLRSAKGRIAQVEEFKKDAGVVKKPIPVGELIEEVDKILATPGPEDLPMQARMTRASHEIQLCAANTAKMEALQEEEEAATTAMSDAKQRATEAFKALVEHFRKHPAR